MSTEANEFEAEAFGRRTRVRYAETATGYALFGLRVVLGWVFFYAGITKLLDPGWTAKGYLQGVPASNPFAGLWTALATDWLWLVDPLNAWGLTLVGAALLLGVAVRWSALWGSVIMLLYWASSLPLRHAIVVDSHVVYVLLLFGLGAFGAGRIAGLDALIERTALVRERPALRYLLG